MESSNECINIDLIFNDWIKEAMIELKPSTLSTYTRQYMAYIRPHLGNVSYGKITSKVINEMTSSLLSSGLSPNTVNGVLTLLATILNSSGITVDFYRPKAVQKDIRVLTEIERALIVDYCCNNVSYINFGILLTLYTGIRLGECCALKTSNIFQAEKVVSIEKTIQRIKNLSGGEGQKTVVIIDNPKSPHSKRKIPLIPIVFKMYRTLFKGKQEDVFLLTGENRYIEPRQMEREFEKVICKLGIKHANYHALRHTFATRFYAKTKDIKALSELLGHANVKITLETYVHTDMAQKRAAMEKMA